VPETNQSATQAVSPEIATQAISPETGSRPTALAGFEEFFRRTYRELVKTAMDAGATKPEAEDAVSKAMIEVLPKWRRGMRPTLTYMRKAVVHNYIKDRVRSQPRVARRLVERGHIPRHEGAEDGRLTAWEDEEWLGQVLSCLPSAQREVMECIARGMARDDIPEVLGKSPATIRRHLCDARARLRAELHPEPEQPSRTTARATREEAR
jgi:RNA polymerase sigma factor (sigma-70 family)